MRVSLIAAMGAILSLWPGDDSRAKIALELAPALEELVAWCQDQRLYQARNELSLALLHFDPEHEKARRLLGYKKNRDGTWRAPRVPARGRNSGKKHLEELVLRLKETLQPFCDRLLRLHNDGTSHNAARNKIVADLLALRPDSEEYRKLDGEVQDDGEWILVETLAIRERREFITNSADQALVDGGEPQPDPLSHSEASAKLDWQNGWNTPHFRVQGTVDSKELKRVAEHLEACVPFYQEVMKPKRPWAGRLTAYLLTSRTEVKTALGARSASGKTLSMTDVGRVWALPELGLIISMKPTPEGRLDSVVRFAMGFLSYAHIGSPPESLDEGLMLYLGQKISTTTLTWAFNTDRYSGSKKKSIKSDLFAENADWLRAARELLASGQRPETHKLLYTTLNAMTEIDYVFSFALAAYLIEGRPQDGVAFLHAMGHRSRPEEALEKTTNLTFQSLDERLVRWLAETEGL